MQKPFTSRHVTVRVRESPVPLLPPVATCEAPREPQIGIPIVHGEVVVRVGFPPVLAALDHLSESVEEERAMH